MTLFESELLQYLNANGFSAYLSDSQELIEVKPRVVISIQSENLSWEGVSNKDYEIAFTLIDKDESKKLELQQLIQTWIPSQDVAFFSLKSIDSNVNENDFEIVFNCRLVTYQ